MGEYTRTDLLSNPARCTWGILRVAQSPAAECHVGSEGSGERLSSRKKVCRSVHEEVFYTIDFLSFYALIYRIIDGDLTRLRC